MEVDLHERRRKVSRLKRIRGVAFSENCRYREKERVTNRREVFFYLFLNNNNNKKKNKKRKKRREIEKVV